MKTKPTLLNFLFVNIFWFKRYFIYTNKKEGLMFIEKDAYKKRRLMELLVCLCPVIKVLFSFALSKLGTWNAVYGIIDLLLIFIILVLFLLRYNNTIFIPIENRDAARDTRIRISEYFYFIFFIVIYFYSVGIVGVLKIIS